jgi:hypothetical protein
MRYRRASAAGIPRANGVIAGVPRRPKATHKRRAYIPWYYREVCKLQVSAGRSSLGRVVDAAAFHMTVVEL